MINFSFDKKLNILINHASGDIDIQEINRHYEFIKENKYKLKNLKVLIDCSEAKFFLNTEEVPIFYNYIKQTLLGYNSITEAIIVKKPYETVIAKLFKEAIDTENYRFKIFYTESAAINWLIT